MYVNPVIGLCGLLREYILKATYTLRFFLLKIIFETCFTHIKACSQEDKKISSLSFAIVMVLRPESGLLYFLKSNKSLQLRMHKIHKSIFPITLPSTAKAINFSRKGIKKVKFYS